jgi:hypothetical protein
MRSTRCLFVLAGTLLLVERSGRAGTEAQSAAMVADGQPALEALVKNGDRASARGDWEDAAHDFGEAAKAAPHDARLRGKLQDALERRARAREARAAKPPPLPPPTMSDGPQDSATVLIFKGGRWQAQLKREALEARLDAEAARMRPDKARIARVRREAAKQRTREERLTVLIKQEQQKEGADKVEMEKAFEGIGGVDSEMKDGVLHVH